MADLLPVDNIPEGCDVLRPAVVVLQVVGMLPYIQAQDGNGWVISHLHEWVVLVGGGGDNELAVLH